MTLLLALYVAAAAFLWLSVFGYLFALASVAMRRRRRGPSVTVWPDVAVVVPTLNEEAIILDKLADLQRTQYPRERLHVVVVDGGSTDRTAALVDAAIANGAPVELQRVEEARSKADQINHIWGRLAQDVVIMTDADTRLEPTCVAQLVATLTADAQTAVVGATVRPASALLEERIHWWFLNYLWWLEGEALSAAVVSGVCYALRREAVCALPYDASADDVHLSLVAAARGWRVRLCRAARAIETRVPQDARELLHFRRRRGAGYVRELLRVKAADAPVGWRVARAVRLLHFRVTPKLAAATLLASLGLVLTPAWPWPLLMGAAFVAPAATAVCASRSLTSDGQRRWRLGLAASRLVGLLWFALLAPERRAWVVLPSTE